MSHSDREIAREVHELLLNARPEPGDPDLIKAASFESSVPTSPDPLKDQAFVAIKQLQAAIGKGASADEAEALLLDAIRAAEEWAVHAT